ncbi:hypothetical protein [Bradyrhizobium sp. LeoA1S1]
MPNDTTQRGYPLPHPDNIAREDASRIRDAIGQISADMQALEERNVIASETEFGSVRLATAAEAATGTATDAVPVVARVKSMIATAIDDLKGGVSSAYDTLVEIAAKLTENDGVIAGILSAIANRVRFDAAQTLDATQQAQARTNIGAQVAGDYQAAGNYQAALGFTPVNKGGDTITGGLTVNGELVAVQNYLRFGSSGSAGYIMWQGGGSYLLSGAGTIWTTGHFGNPFGSLVSSLRLVHAADHQLPVSGMQEPYGGCVMTGFDWANSTAVKIRLRYLQFAINGAWYTAGYA